MYTEVGRLVRAQYAQSLCSTQILEQFYKYLDSKSDKFSYSVQNFKACYKNE